MWTACGGRLRWVARAACLNAVGGESRTRGDSGGWREPHAWRLRRVARGARVEIAAGGERRTRGGYGGWLGPHARRLRRGGGARGVWLREGGGGWGARVLVG